MTLLVEPPPPQIGVVVVVAIVARFDLSLPIPTFTPDAAEHESLFYEPNRNGVSNIKFRCIGMWRREREP